MMLTSFSDFAAAAASTPGALVARTIPAAGRTPVDLYRRAARPGQAGFLLESVEGGGALARYSFIGAGPYTSLRGTPAGTYIQRPDEEPAFDSRNAVAVLRELLSRNHVGSAAGLPPFAGGAVGYLAYEAAQWFEASLTDSGLPPPMTLARFLLVESLLAFDHQTGTITIISLAPDRGDELRPRYDAACARIAALEACIAQPAAPAGARTGPAPRFHSNFERADFEHAVRQIQEHIVAGDCYQAVLSQKLVTQADVPALAAYEALRRINPSPYLFLLDFGDEQLVGASPEMLVRCRDGLLEYRPIAGTCPRGGSAAEDERLAARLLADEKERAEHIMLVDLGRNDLGRIAVTGSVDVTRLMYVERYSHVQHIVTDLRARLRPDAGPFDALAACFPAGTVTGAPKIRAMQILRGLERAPRGPYGGAVLYADIRGNLDSCIAIRTMHLRGGTAEVQAGAGVVFDSRPDSEYQETLHKAGALLEAVRSAAGGRP